MVENGVVRAAARWVACLLVGSVAPVVLATGALAAAPAATQQANPAAVAVDDPGVGRQWALDRIGAPEAWAVATGAGVTVAVVDSGIAVDHPDLRDQVIAAADCVGHDDVPGGCVPGSAGDQAGHGTHVAGIVAAAADNGQGVAGVAPLARLLAVRVLADSCDGDEAADGCEAEGRGRDVAEGIRWASDNGADVINLSLGSVTQIVLGPGRAVQEALEHAWAQGAIPVLVAGNDLLPPGGLADVPAVVVTATDRNDEPASYAAGVGEVRWGVAAPGGESDTAQSCSSPTPNGILSTFVHAAGGSAGEPGYACVAGTSMAAPHVAGALAVLRSAGLSPQAAVDRLLATAQDLGAPGKDGTFGAGRIDLARATEGLVPTGQPVRATRDSSAVGPSPTALATPGGRPSTVPPEVAVPTTTPAVPAQPPGATTTVAGTGDGAADSGSTSSTGDTPTTGDGERLDDEQAAGASDGRAGSDDLPDLPVSAAVLLVVAVVVGHAWRYLATAPWARRTPPDR
jgi:subtilisin family serine protease